MERPANEGGPHHEPGQRFDDTHRSEPVVCPLDPLRDCHNDDTTRRLGTVTYCADCAADFLIRLRRRIARRAASLPEDSPMGLGMAVVPATDWPSPYHLLRCDMCPRTWVGLPYEPCDACAEWWRKALRGQVSKRGRDDVA